MEMSKRKQLGQYYTSPEIADLMVELITQPKISKVLEPSFGNGVFIESLINRGFDNINGVELDPKNFQLAKKYTEANLINCDFLSTSKKDKYDVIIGNPPYVAWKNIAQDTKDLINNIPFWEKYKNGQFDLLYAFIIWSVEKLNTNGELIFIVPYNWFNSTYAKSLRSYMVKQGYFDTICHFGELKLFKDCYPNNIIFKFIKSKTKNKPIKVFEYSLNKASIKALPLLINSELKKLEYDLDYYFDGSEYKSYQNEQFKNSQMWYLAPRKDSKLLEKIESSSIFKLSDVTNVAVGYASGLNEAFIITGEQYSDLSSAEKLLTRKFIKAENCMGYYTKGSSRYIYANNIIDEAELQNYKNLYKILLPHKLALTKRHLAKNKKWWHWATVRNEKLFGANSSQGKIFVPGIDRSKYSRYSYSNKDYLATSDVITIFKKSDTKEANLYILAWLNSSFINSWYRTKGMRTGERIKYTQSYVAQIPFLAIDWSKTEHSNIHNEIVKLTSQLLNGKKQKNIISRKIDNLYSMLLEDS